jgi:hypothetical protein
MSDVTLELTTQTPITLAQSTTSVALSITDASPVTLASSPVSVALSITDATPVTLALGCFDMRAWLGTVNEYDSDADAITAGETYYKASAAHESAYKGTFIIL